jgi:hypothetical protein
VRKGVCREPKIVLTVKTPFAVSHQKNSLQTPSSQKKRIRRELLTTKYLFAVSQKQLTTKCYFAVSA